MGMYLAKSLFLTPLKNCNVINKSDPDRQNDGADLDFLALGIPRLAGWRTGWGRTGWRTGWVDGRAGLEDGEWAGGRTEALSG